MRRETVLGIWIGGFVLAVLLYAIGPDRFFDACLNFFDAIDALARNLVVALGAQTYGVVRALALAIYVVFVVLALLATRNGHPGVWAFLVVTAVYLMLVWRPYAIYPAPLSRWLAALILSVAAAVIMTQRLMAPPRRLGPPPPYPPGHV